MQRLPGHVARAFRREQHVAADQFVRLPRPLSGTFAPNFATCSAVNVDGISGVQIGPGATALTRMSRSASSADSDRVNATIAPLVASSRGVSDCRDTRSPMRC